MKKVVAVVAAYDEQDTIADLTRRLDLAMRALEAPAHELIFVVEGVDGTRGILEGLAAELGSIRILYSARPSGLGNAFRRGFAAVPTDADLVVTLDADLNHAPEEIPALVSKLEEERLDIVVGSRFVQGSRTEGVPLWKRGLSSLMNRVIAELFDVSIRDKTSGFRLYRAEALRQLLDYRNQDFAFLPEMLIRASERGLSIGEAPIHFRFRTRGHSKMDLGQTVRSYLALLRTRFDALSVAALLVLLVGIGARLLYAFPLHKYVPDADSVLSGLRALDIRAGKLRIFYSYTRLGALESYLHAAAYSLFGVSRLSISLAPLCAGASGLLVFFFFCRELFGRRTAVFALIFFALPSCAYIAWTYMPNGYPETMLFCLLTLYFSARMLRTGFTPASAAALGLSAGLGLWNSFQTLMCTVPAFAWLLVLRRRDIRTSGRSLAVLGLAFAAGASPWILYNARYSLASLRHDLGGRPAASANAIWTNAAYFLENDLFQLTLDTNPFAFAGVDGPVQRALRWPAAAIYAAGLVTLVSYSRKRARAAGAFREREGVLLLGMIGVVALTLDSVSAAGESRGLTVRYALPVFVIFAVAAGALSSALWKRSAGVTTAVVLAVLALNVSGYFLPWTESRRYFRDLMKKDSEVVEYLRREGVRWVCGNYWIVYPLNFVSREHVLGIPFQAEHDHYQYVLRLPAHPVPWGIVARDRGWLERWVSLAGVHGRIVDVGSGYHVFRPDASENEHRSPQMTLWRLRNSVIWGH